VLAVICKVSVATNVIGKEAGEPFLRYDSVIAPDVYCLVYVLAESASIIRVIIVVVVLKYALIDFIKLEQETH